MRSYVILSVFPIGVLRKVYTTYLLSSKLYGFFHIELKETINHYMLHHFLLIFYTGFEGVLATYQTVYSSHFSHKVFGGDLSR